AFEVDRLRAHEGRTSVPGRRQVDAVRGVDQDVLEVAIAVQDVVVHDPIVVDHGARGAVQVPRRQRLGAPWRVVSDGDVGERIVLAIYLPGLDLRWRGRRRHVRDEVGHGGV